MCWLLQDDYGWADAGWHRVDVRTGAGTPDPDVQSESQAPLTHNCFRRISSDRLPAAPNMDALIKEGIEMDRQYVCESFSDAASTANFY